MIIDAHTHVWKYPEHMTEAFSEPLSQRVRADEPLAFDVDLDTHFEEMKLVDKAVVFAFWAPGYLTVPNEYVSEYVNDHPDKLIGFMSFDPNDVKGAIKEMEYAADDLGLKGIKLYPVLQRFRIDDEKYFPIYEKAQEMGLIINFHLSTVPFRETPLKVAHPLMLEDVAIAFPDLKMYIAHLGHPWVLDAIMVIRKHPNCYADISGMVVRPWMHYNMLAYSVEYQVLDKLLFGSDYPLMSIKQTLDGLKNVNSMVEGTNLPRIPEAAIENILDKNCKEFFDLR